MSAVCVRPDPLRCQTVAAAHAEVTVTEPVAGQCRQGMSFSHLLDANIPPLYSRSSRAAVSDGGPVRLLACVRPILPRVRGVGDGGDRGGEAVVWPYAEPGWNCSKFKLFERRRAVERTGGSVADAVIGEIRDRAGGATLHDTG